METTMPFPPSRSGKTSLCILFTLLLLLASCSEKSTTTFQGYIEGEFINLASSEAGRLDRLLVTRGQRVPAGAPLFALDSASEAAVHRQAQQHYQAAEAQLRDIGSGKRQTELAVIEAQILQAMAAADKSTAQRIRYESLYQSKFISKADLEAAVADAESNAARVRELRNQLAAAKLPAREEQIKAQSALMAAARAALEQAEWKLRQKSVKSPRAGLVFDTLYREGEWVPGGKPVVRLLPPNGVKVRFFVPEPVLGTLSMGQGVNISCDGCPGDIPAKITYISVEAEFTPPIIYSNETRSKLVFMIEAHPSEDNPSILHPGQPVEVRFR